jgi:hypothetical protein
MKGAGKYLRAREKNRTKLEKLRVESGLRSRITTNRTSCKNVGMRKSMEQQLPSQRLLTRNVRHYERLGRFGLRFA